MVLCKQTILSELRRHQPELARWKVRRLGLFGSFARDDGSAESDIDLLVDFQAGEKTIDNFMGVAFFLEDLFQRKVEVVTTESLSPYLAPQVLHEATYVEVGNAVPETHTR